MGSNQEVVEPATPLGDFHALYRDGGLGIPVFMTVMMGMILDGLTVI